MQEEETTVCYSRPCKGLQESLLQSAKEGTFPSDIPAADETNIDGDPFQNELITDSWQKFTGE